MPDEQIIVRPVTPDDTSSWLRMRGSLWPDSSVDHQKEVAAYFAGTGAGPAIVLLACEPAGGAVGFVELSVRPSAEGCSTDHVLYLEGWYVEPSRRKRGVGQLLIHAAEDWGRSQGCTEFASDAAMDNLASHQAHRALGFVEVQRVISFKKNL